MTGRAPDATVTELWRFPVKSMQGEQLDAADLEATGMVGDRAWGVISADGRHVLSAKTVPDLLFARAATTGDGVTVTLPSGAEVLAGTAEADEALSTWLERPVRLLPAGAAHDEVGGGGDGLAYEMTLDPPNDDADLFAIPTPAGSLHDLFPLHVLTDASLAAVGAARPELDWDVRRYRPNVVLRCAPGATGYAEDAWVGHDVAVGTATVHVPMATVRCAVPLRAQPGGVERDVELYRALDELHANHLGAYVEVHAPGRIAVGDDWDVAPAATT